MALLCPEIAKLIDNTISRVNLPVPPEGFGKEYGDYCQVIEAKTSKEDRERLIQHLMTCDACDNAADAFGYSPRNGSVFVSDILAAWIICEIR